MEIRKRGGTRIIPNHALDTIGNPSEACLPPFRFNLTSYALEYGGALRMIRVSECPLGRGAGPGYIALSLQHEPLDQTNLSNGLDAS